MSEIGWPKRFSETEMEIYAPQIETIRREEAERWRKALVGMTAMKPHYWECDCAACQRARLLLNEEGVGY